MGKFVNSPRVWLEKELLDFARSLPEASLVLDAGAGKQPYKSMFDHCQYESTDFEQVDKQYSPSTYVCDLADIPVDDGRFDAVAFTQVMEHLPDPLAALRELYRVTKPGGRLFYTGPLFYEEHEQPYDFYRYTQFGVRHLFEKAGFEIEELRPCDGYMSVAAHQLRFMSKRLPRNPSEYMPGIRGYGYWLTFFIFRMIIRRVVKMASRSGAAMRIDKVGICMNYLALVRKPG